MKNFTPAATLPANQTQQQRKQATILFCDIVDYTQRTLANAPEEIAADIHLFQTICQRAAEQHSGKIAFFAGDGTMIVFGHPHTTEHDAVNAISCALAIKKEIERRKTGWLEKNKNPLKIRCAIDTSLICFTPPTREQQPLGESMFGVAPNLAARLQQSADTWQVLVSNNTFKLTRPYFDFEKMPQRTLKGFPQPVSAWRVIAEKPAITTPHQIRQDYFTRFTNRDKELATLTADANKCRDNDPQFFFISGECGIGKSRLLHEFYSQLPKHEFYQVHIRCNKRSLHLAFAPVIHEVYRWYRLQPGDPIMRKQILLTQALSVQGITDHQSLAIFFELMSVPLPRHIKMPTLTDEQKYQHKLDLLSKLLFRMTLQRPVILLIDQLESADHATRDWLNNVSQNTTQERLMTVVCSRNSEDAKLLPTDCKHLPLPPFNPQDSFNLIDSILHGRRYKGFDIEQIATLCDGIPLYIEEVCWNILWHVKQGELASYDNLIDLPIPDVLSNLLNSWIGQLGQARATAELIATLQIPVKADFIKDIAQLLHVHCDNHIKTLTDKHILFINEAGELQFTRRLFAHALYLALPENKRQMYHDVIANSLIQHHSNKQAIIAEHFSKAKNHNQAALYWSATVKSLLETHQFKAAFHACEKGLNALAASQGFLDKDNEIELELSLNQIYCSWYVDQRRPQHLYNLQRCATIAHNLNKPWIALKSYCLQALYQIALSRPQAINSGLLRLRRYEQHTNSHASTQLIATAKFFRGQHQKALPSFHQCHQIPLSELMQQSNCDLHLYALSLAFDAINLLILNHTNQAQEQINQLGDNLSHFSPAHRIEALLGICIYYQLLQQHKKCLKLSKQALTLAEHNDLPGLATAAQIFVDFCQIMLNDNGRHLDHLEKNIRCCQTYFGFTLTAYLTLLLAQAKTKCGDLLRADISASDAIQIGRTTAEKWILPLAFKMRGDIVRANRYSKHEFMAHYNEGIKLAEQHGAAFFTAQLRADLDY